MNGNDLFCLLLGHTEGSNATKNRNIQTQSNTHITWSIIIQAESKHTIDNTHTSCRFETFAIWSQ